MSLTPKLRKLIYGSGLVATTLLTGCGGGGGGGSATPEAPANVAPTVAIAGANQSLEKKTIEMAANASDLDGTIASFSWSVDNPAVELTGADSANISFVAPSVEENLEFVITLTVTDDDGATATSSLVFTSKPIKKSLFIQGLVKDEKITYADVTLEIGDESFNVRADSQGTYSIDLEVDERNFDNLVKITALGTEDKHAGVKLISLLESFNTVKASETSQEFVLANNYFGVNVTNVTTAEYVLLKRLNNGNEITTEARLHELQQLLAADFKQIQELASVLKVVIDNPDYDLPEAVSDTLELLNNNEVYTQVLSEINSDPELIATTILEIWGDHDLVEFPDTDGDGILNICDPANPTPNTCDPDFDNDGYLNEVDFYPLDKNKYAPTIGALTFRPDPGRNSSRFRHCITYTANVVYGVDGSDLDDTSILEIKDLDCSEFKEMTHTDNLQYFTHLNSISFKNAQLTDLSVLAELTNLKSLSIQNMPELVNFDFLTNLTNLEKLDLTGSKFNNLGALVGLTKLSNLNLNGALVSDLTSLSSLVNLNSLDVSYTQVSDLTFTESMTNLSSLYAHNSNVQTLPDFTKLVKLNDVSFYDNNIVDISPLANLVAFTSLDLHGNKIKNLNPLSSLTSLQTLNLSDNDINSLAGIEALTELTSLSLNINPITDFSALSSLTKLEALNLSETGVSDLSIIEASTALTYLDVSNNTIVETEVDPQTQEETVTVISSLTDVSPLAVHTNLTTLLANNNTIDNFNSLNTLINLQRLNLSANEIVEVSAVASMAALERLYLNANNISDLTDLLEATTLPLTLHIAGNPHSCEQNNWLKEKAESLSLVSDFVGNEECKEPVLRDAITNKPVSAIFKREVLNLSRSGGSTNLGEIDMVACIGAMWNGYPLCWESNSATSNTPVCSAEENATQMICKDTGWDLYEYPVNSGKKWKIAEWSLEFDSSIPAGNVFRDSFERRLILTILHTDYARIYNGNGDEFDVCPSIGEGQYQCTITGDHFEGEISWVQDFPNAHFPRCSAQAGSSIATCTPGASPDALLNAAYNGVIPELDDSQSFEVDFSKIRIVPFSERSTPVECEDDICQP
ncbi:leucine-rich repeat domain-containing protein [Thalassomonas sp. M1454]|uniref:leucine-rich repeat domain-containing protein n=1 Tax=Thalassomonas sp. M1454 TaxID=2594477 RepID=UPI00117BF88A|nr:leucine-rich repeat domain-containing protein [Thalassomonas sp. M1454]TRX55906.1 hypothetical protein FNN08_09875 [Thalassomonas sp. M1454]